MSRIVFALIVGLSFSGVASAQDDPPPPCGLPDVLYQWE